MKGDLRVSTKKSGPFCKLGALGDTPFAEISKTSLESTKKWWYKVDKKCFGPFSTQLMRTWYTNKKLLRSLLISVSENGPFVPLFTFPEPRFEWIKEVREERRSIVKLVTKVPSRRRMTTVNQKLKPSVRTSCPTRTRIRSETSLGYFDGSVHTFTLTSASTILFKEWAQQYEISRTYYVSTCTKDLQEMGFHIGGDTRVR